MEGKMVIFDGDKRVFKLDTDNTELEKIEENL